MDDLEINRRVAEVAGIKVTEEAGQLWLASSEDGGELGWLTWRPTWNSWQCMELQERFHVEAFPNFHEIGGVDEQPPGYWEAAMHWEEKLEGMSSTHWREGPGVTNPSLKRVVCLAIIAAHDQGAVDE